MFKNILGNETIKEMLEQALNGKKVSHSYMFVGTSGIGKKMIATEFAKSILCLNSERYCNSCKSCIEFDTQNHPDFLIIKPDGNKIKIEQIRELQKRIQEKPIISGKKVYIIDDADLMTKEAQNCLLKTLEEPPEYASLILIGSSENAFLATIKSRCMIIHFNPIPDEEIKKYLSENYQIKEITKNMLETFQGSIGKAIALKDKQEEYQAVEKIIENLQKKDLIDIIPLSEVLYKAKEEITEILDYMNILLLKKAKTNEKYVNCIKIVEDTKKRLKQNANYDMAIDNLLFNIWEEII